MSCRISKTKSKYTVKILSQNCIRFNFWTLYSPRQWKLAYPTGSWHASWNRLSKSEKILSSMLFVCSFYSPRPPRIVCIHYCPSNTLNTKDNSKEPQSRWYNQFKQNKSHTISADKMFLLCVFQAKCSWYDETIKCKISQLNFRLILI